jgi:hypothetical protein
VPRRFNWLIISVAGNLLLLGLIVAWIVSMPPPHRPLVSWQQEVLPSLGQADAAIVSGAASRIAAAQDQANEALQQQYAQVHALLAAEPLDQAALQQAMTRISVIRNDEQVATRRVFFQELVSVSPAGRARLLAALEKESQHWRHHPGH